MSLLYCFPYLSLPTLAPGPHDVLSVELLTQFYNNLTYLRLDSDIFLRFVNSGFSLN